MSMGDYLKGRQEMQDEIISLLKDHYEAFLCAQIAASVPVDKRTGFVTLAVDIKAKTARSFTVSDVIAVLKTLRQDSLLLRLNASGGIIESDIMESAHAALRTGVILSLGNKN